jgi:hypothetical protein
MEPESSSWCSQEVAAGPCSDADEADHRRLDTAFMNVALRKERLADNGNSECIQLLVVGLDMLDLCVSRGAVSAGRISILFPQSPLTYIGGE